MGHCSPVIKEIAFLLQQIPPDATLKDLGQNLVTYLQSLPVSVRAPLTEGDYQLLGTVRCRVQGIIPKMVSPVGILRLLSTAGFLLGLVVLPRGC